MPKATSIDVGNHASFHLKRLQTGLEQIAQQLKPSLDAITTEKAGFKPFTGSNFYCLDLEYEALENIPGYDWFDYQSHRDDEMVPKEPPPLITPVALNTQAAQNAREHRELQEGEGWWLQTLHWHASCITSTHYPKHDGTNLAAQDLKELAKIGRVIVNIRYANNIATAELAANRLGNDGKKLLEKFKECLKAPDRDKKSLGWFALPSTKVQ